MDGGRTSYRGGLLKVSSGCHDVKAFVRCDALLLVLLVTGSVLGLYLLRMIPLRFSIGSGLSDWLEARAGAGAAGVFLLGTAFSFAFCPTLFLLFFGLTIPLTLRSSVGVLYPGVFAVGATLPLIGLAALLAAGVGATRGYVRVAKRVDAWLWPLAAGVLVLAGLNDTLTYWFL